MSFLCLDLQVIDGNFMTFRLLLTIPASVGYDQNPLSVYYCYEEEEEEEESSRQLKMCIAEVSDGWCFVISTNSSVLILYFMVFGKAGDKHAMGGESIV